MARDGATPTIFGPSPLNRDRIPSVSTMCFRHCIILIDFAVDDRLHDEIAITCCKDNFFFCQLKQELSKFLKQQITCGRFFKMVEQNLFRDSCALIESCLPVDGPLAVNRGGKNADELCRRVLTTSNGHVTTAPTVPATLQRQKRKKECG